jgi:predicted MFS family arabinose efflux permease
MPGLFARLLHVSTDHPAPYRYPLWAASVLLVPAVMALRSIGEFSTGQQIEQKAGRGSGGAPLVLIGTLSVALFLQVTAQSATMGFFNVYMDDGLKVPTFTIGALSAVAQLLSAGGALVTPALSKRWGTRRAFVWSSLGAALCTLPLAFVPHWGAVGLGYLGITALYGITFPAINVYQMELVSPEWRTAMSGSTAMANGLNWSLAAYAGGQVIAQWGYQPLFLVSAGLTVAGALLFGAYFEGRTDF